MASLVSLPVNSEYINHLLNINDDALMQIFRYIVINPNDLCNFGNTCKKMKKIIDNKPFQDLILICQRKLPLNLRERFEALRGSTGFNGLIHNAYLKNVAVENSISRARELHWGIGNSNSQEILLVALESGRKAYDVYNELRSELKELAIWNDAGQIVGGKIYQILSGGNISQYVQGEIKRIQNYLCYNNQ